MSKPKDYARRLAKLEGRVEALEVAVEFLFFADKKEVDRVVREVWNV